MNRPLAALLLITGLLWPAASAAHDAAQGQAGQGAVTIRLPDITVAGPQGMPKHLVSEIIANKIVVLNFIFTSCTTSCPLVTANLRALQDELKDRNDVVFVSVSIDPDNDTPKILQDFAAKFDPRPGWWFVKAEKHDLDTLLRSVGAKPGSSAQHLTQVFIGHADMPGWQMVEGTAGLTYFHHVIEDAAALAQNDKSAYFTNLPLVDAFGTPVRFYRDILFNKTVLVLSLYTSCQGACPVMVERVQAAIERLPANLQDRFSVVAITSDPDNDTPEKLKTFAEDHALDHWQFLTGKKENVDWVLYKLGLYVEDPRQHSTVLLVGSEPGGQWLKTLAIADASQLSAVLEKFAADGTRNAQ